MTSHDPIPVSPRRAHTDIPGGGWIDRHAPAAVRPYLRLARLDRPIGTWLLLFPCWWSAALAADGMPDPWLMALFAVGAVVMRGAGCTVNDILDRDFDAQVERTRGRPIPSGQVGVGQALAFLALLLALGLAVLVQLDPLAIFLGAASLLLVFAYPLMKRVTWWPQAFLGLTFNWGALLGWAAVRGTLDLPALLLYAGGLFWTLGYDTIYAHQDKEDDVLIGVKSTALRLGESSSLWISVFYLLAGLLFAAAGVAAGLPLPWWPLLLLPALLQLAWQARAWRMGDPADCLAKFRSNRWFGWLMLAAILAANTLPGFP